MAWLGMGRGRGAGSAATLGCDEDGASVWRSAADNNACLLNAVLARSREQAIFLNFDVIKPHPSFNKGLGGVEQHKGVCRHQYPPPTH